MSKIADTYEADLLRAVLLTAHNEAVKFADQIIAADTLDTLPCSLIEVGEIRHMFDSFINKYATQLAVIEQRLTTYE